MPKVSPYYVGENSSDSFENWRTDVGNEGE